VVLVCEKHKDHGEPPSEIDSLRSKLADAERERDGLREACEKALPVIANAIVHGMPVTPQVADARNSLCTALARPVTITRISHPESNARPADAGEDGNA
jgi:hypothetical protein